MSKIILGTVLKRMNCYHLDEATHAFVRGCRLLLRQHIWARMRCPAG